MWQEFMERRIQQADRYRETFHRLEDAFEVFALEGEQLLQGLFAVDRPEFRRRSSSRMATMRSSSKNICSVRHKTDAFSTETHVPA